MGCTSSAPNIPPSHTNSEKDMSTTEELHEGEETEKQPNEVIHHKETEINGIKVLPTCDTLDEPTQLDRNNKTFVDMSPPEPEQDLGAIQDLLNSDDTSVHNSGMKMSSSEEKLSKMEEVVEKVVELYVENIGEKSHDLSTKIENMTVTTEKENKETSFAQPSRVEENETDESTEIFGEMVGPTQSPSSRATRWEALADIAAELPPSLTVDPLTGQIYAVSK